MTVSAIKVVKDKEVFSPYYTARLNLNRHHGETKAKLKILHTNIFFTHTKFCPFIPKIVTIRSHECVLK